MELLSDIYILEYWEKEKKHKSKLKTTSSWEKDLKNKKKEEYLKWLYGLVENVKFPWSLVLSK